jgi:hypothetical protein
MLSKFHWEACIMFDDLRYFNFCMPESSYGDSSILTLLKQILQITIKKIPIHEIALSPNHA